MHPHKRDAEAIDLIDYMDILQIRKVIDVDNTMAVQLVIDAYLSEKDSNPEGEQMSEVAEPENGEETPEGENGEETPEAEGNDEGKESEATE